MTPYRQARPWLVALLIVLAGALSPTFSRAQDQPAHFKVGVRGQVMKPGIYEIAPDFSVIDTIELAGGFTPRALRTAVEIIRIVQDGGQPKRTVYRMDYSDYPLNNANADFKLQKGDVISVPTDPTYGK